MGFLISLGLLCIVWSVVTSVLIAIDLRKRGISTSIFFLKFMILKYLHIYAKLTQEQNGKVGPLFYHYILPLNIGVVIFVFLAILYW